MTEKPENNENFQNYVEQTEDQIIKKIKEDLNPIQENLLEQKITVDEAKSELKKINEWLQGTKLEQKNKNEIGKAFDKLNQLKKDIDENTLKNEVDKIVKLIENLTKKDLANLKHGIKKNKQRWNPERPPEVQEGIDEASDNLRKLSEQEDINFVADWARKKIGELGEFFS